MNIIAAGLFTETNTFSPIPTGINDFEIIREEDIKSGRHSISEMVPFKQWEQKAEIRDDHFMYGLFAWAQPAGITSRLVYENLRDEILDKLRSCRNLDIILLCLHGAMVAQGYEDCEGDLIKHIRKFVGPDVVVAAELDLHCHLTQLMIEHSDILLTYKEYPHTDIGVRGEELFDLAVKTRLGDIHPTMACFDCKMVGVYPTSGVVMSNFIESLYKAEQMSDVLAVSFVHGFNYGDVPEAGGKMLVASDDDPELAERVAEELGRKVHALRKEISIESIPMEIALSQSQSKLLQIKERGHGPIVVADQSDNAGGGAPSDSTYALRWLFDHKVQDAAVAIIYDPEVVKLAVAAGVGAVLDVRLGGKMGTTSGEPLDICVTVGSIKENYFHKFPQGKEESIPISLGDTVLLSCAGIDIVVSSVRSQCFSPCIFEDLAVNVSSKLLLVIKSTQHFYDAFLPIASEIIYMAAPGAVPPIVKQIPYERMMTTDKYPWVENPSL